MLTKLYITLARVNVLSRILAIFFCSIVITAQIEPPRLLLTARRLKRLQRDRERQTERWLNFEKRVNSIPDSPERGFELALYFAVTHDEKRGKEAIEWALAHKCDARQVALILDWCDGLVPHGDRPKLLSPNCPDGSHAPLDMQAIRDTLLSRIVRGEDPEQLYTGKQLEKFDLTDPRELYAASEYMEAVRETQHVDIRQDNPAFFQLLPAQFLLSMKPRELDSPTWQAAAAALALVSLDPNLEGSQFLQGWAMEDRQMIREGPGVAYELLWGDPYLPGVSYRNLDPSSYDPEGRLFARTDWDPHACWINISTRGVEEANCPADWRQHTQTFGSMTLVPMTEPCIDVARLNGRRAEIIWRLQPRQTVSYINDKKKVSGQADPAGLWVLPGYIGGKVCTSPAQK